MISAQHIVPCHYSITLLQDSPREGVLACVFGLFAYSAWFAALHVYLIMLLNGTKSAAAEAAARNDRKTVSTLQVRSVHSDLVKERVRFLSSITVGGTVEVLYIYY